jgi:hypothetical protein
MECCSGFGVPANNLHYVGVLLLVSFSVFNDYRDITNTPAYFLFLSRLKSLKIPICGM